LRHGVRIGADLVYEPTAVQQLVRTLSVLLQKRPHKQSLSEESTRLEAGYAPAPVAYIASALRNLTTLDLFVQLAESASLEVVDLTAALMPLRILPDIYGLDRSQIRLYRVSYP
jgi:hypothetical protein